MALRTLATFIFLATGFAQTPIQTVNPCLQQACFWATQSGSVGSSSAITLTIQQPASGGRAINFIAAVIQCPGQSFTVDQSQNGTAATATAGTSTALPPNTTVVSKANVFTSSNVGAGTAMAPTLTYSSGSIAVISLNNVAFNTSGTAVNYSLKLTNTGTGSCTGSVAIYWQEQY